MAGECLFRKQMLSYVLIKAEDIRLVHAILGVNKDFFRVPIKSVLGEPLYDPVSGSLPSVFIKITKVIVKAHDLNRLRIFVQQFYKL